MSTAITAFIILGLAYLVAGFIVWAFVSTGGNYRNLGEAFLGSWWLILVWPIVFFGSR